MFRYTAQTAAIRLYDFFGSNKEVADFGLTESDYAKVRDLHTALVENEKKTKLDEILALNGFTMRDAVSKMARCLLYNMYKYDEKYYDDGEDPLFVHEQLVHVYDKMMRFAPMNGLNPPIMPNANESVDLLDELSKFGIEQFVAYGW